MNKITSSPTPRAISVLMRMILASIERYGALNQDIVKKTKLLALNASIEAARSGEVGRGFAVVAGEIQKLASKADEASQKLRTDVMEKVTLGGSVSERLVDFTEGDRLKDLAQTLVQLIVRNLYERTADVRWWATDSAMWTALQSKEPAAIAHAQQRLEVINRFYSVYSDLILIDAEGNVLASANARYREKVRKSGWAGQQIFSKAMATASGDEYVVGKVERSAQHDNAEALLYATAVRAGGAGKGAPLGVLAVMFNWQRESRTIVNDEPNFPPEVAQRSTVMLLDAEHRIIASSCEQDLFKTFALNNGEKVAGFYYERQQGRIVAYAKTLGYQEYDGLGWWSVVTQTVDTDEAITANLVALESAQSAATR